MAVYSWLCARPSGMAAFNNSFGLMRIAFEYVKIPSRGRIHILNYVVVLIGLSFSPLFEVTSSRLFVYCRISFLYIRSSTMIPTIGKNRAEEFDSSSMNDTITISLQISCGRSQQRVENAWNGNTSVKTAC